ncbi:hypothetical protein TNCT_437281 [Trichonephila clavata]|uniref:Uncharacterized protein n=1 Tax=Trichonephila clavata TaxID=2740835 RepID=A0A8X6M0G9_TRICU|nr:hypothetical protein TNCT_437281 [Trichonephila clavata]
MPFTLLKYLENFFKVELRVSFIVHSGEERFVVSFGKTPDNVLIMSVVTKQFLLNSFHVYREANKFECREPGEKISTIGPIMPKFKLNAVGACFLRCISKIMDEL